jgi:tRNA U38,U39,U40 pseudouridine synthase TruA
MVRFLVSGMIETGMGRLGEDEFIRMLEGGSRLPYLTPSDPTGLFLWKVRYQGGRGKGEVLGGRW